MTTGDVIADVSAERVASRARALLARHWLIFALVTAGITLRVLAMIAYPYAFFYNDSRPYIEHAVSMRLHTIRPFGYSAFLKPFVWSGRDDYSGALSLVALTQHLLIVVLAIVVYIYLVRRGIRRWIAALGAAPLLIGPSEIILEHYALAETLFTILVVLGLGALAWPWRGRVWAAALGGLLLAGSALTRSIGLPLCALGGLYLLCLVRVTSWRPLLAYGVVAAGLLGAYVVAYHHTYGVYAFGQYQGRFLYARTMTIADCAKLTGVDQRLCTPADKSQRPELIDWYVWSPDSPANTYYPGRAGDPQLGAFARRVIEQQPTAYAAMVARETAAYFVPALRPHDRNNTCMAGRWLPSERTNEKCGPQDFTATSIQRPRPAQPPGPATAAGRALTWIGGSQIAFGPLMALALAGIVAAAATAFIRRRDRRIALDALLFGAAGFAVILIAVATSMFELRYAVPAVPLIAIGAALATRQIPTATSAKASRRTA